MQKITANIFLVLLLFTLSTCKKYPENTLWFKNPEKLYPFYGHLTTYKVNDIDSLDLLNNYYGSKSILQKNIRDAMFATFVEHGRVTCELIYGSSYGSSYGVIYYKFTTNKKQINIALTNDTTIYNKNIFIDGEVKWDIIRLSRNGHFSLKTTLNNGNKYEIQIR